MTAADLIRTLRRAGVYPLLTGDRVRLKSAHTIPASLIELARSRKLELIEALQAEALPDPKAEARRQRCLAMLAADPTLPRAVVVEPEGNVYRIAIAVRGKFTCEMEAKADPQSLLDALSQAERTDERG